MRKFGIDISKWQKGFNFDKAIAEGVEFVILRGAYHMSKDTCFEDFYAACKSRKLPVGVYHYSMAKTAAAAKEEAQFLIQNVLKGKTFEYPIYMDVEDKTQLALGKDLLTDIVVAFCDTLEKAGYYTGIYSSARFLAAYTHEEKLARFDMWIAHWNTKCSYTGDYGLWQFGGETNYIRSNKIAGVTCDQDYALKDYPAIIKKAGLNGYGKAPAKPAAAKLTVDGLWGASTTKRLQEIFGTTVDGKVSNQLAKYQYSNPGLKSGWEWLDKPNVKGSQLIKAMQKWAGMATNAQDGLIGPTTIKAFQKKLGTYVDGKVSNPSAMVKALQKWANNQ